MARQAHAEDLHAGFQSGSAWAGWRVGEDTAPAICGAADCYRATSRVDLGKTAMVEPWIGSSCSYGHAEAISA